MKNLSKYGRVYILILIVCLFFPNLSSANAEKKPLYYNEVKIFFDSCAERNYGMDGKAEVGRQIMMTKKDEIAPAMLALFSDVSDNYCQTSGKISKDDYLVNILVCMDADVVKEDESKKMVVDFLTERLIGKSGVLLKKQGGEMWVSTAMGVLRNSAPEKAREVALQALYSPNIKIRNAAAWVLAKAGKVEDIDKLKAEIGKYQYEIDQINKSIDRINKRAAGKDFTDWEQ